MIACPNEILDFWFAGTENDADRQASHARLWWKKSETTDQVIKAMFEDTVIALADGLVREWSEGGMRDQLAAIIALDQFPRNIYRGTAQAFTCDPLALALTVEGVARADHKSLSEAERQFLYLPLEHSERLCDQHQCVDLFEALVDESRPGFRPLMENALGFAIQHRDVVEKFGRFPHRNEILGRSSTEAELAYLAQPGSGF